MFFPLYFRENKADKLRLSAVEAAGDALFSMWKPSLKCDN